MSNLTGQKITPRSFVNKFEELVLKRLDDMTKENGRLMSGYDQITRQIRTGNGNEILTLQGTVLRVTHMNANIDENPNIPEWNRTKSTFKRTNDGANIRSIDQMMQDLSPESRLNRASQLNAIAENILNKARDTSHPNSATNLRDKNIDFGNALSAYDKIINEYSRIHKITIRTSYARNTASGFVGVLGLMTGLGPRQVVPGETVSFTFFERGMQVNDILKPFKRRVDGREVSASQMETIFNQIFQEVSKLAVRERNYEVNFCHSSCHSDCHSSGRGRR